MKVRGLCFLGTGLLAVALAGCNDAGGSGSNAGGSSTSGSTAVSSTSVDSVKTQSGAGTAQDPDATNPGSKGTDSRASADPGRITIVSSLPRTGNARQQTDTIVNGIRMAIDEVDSRIGDFEITYRDYDDATASAGEWTQDQEAANANRAAADPNVMVYIGPYNSGAAKTSIPILNAAHLLMVSPACTAVWLTKPNPDNPQELANYRKDGINFVRVVPTDDVQGPLGAEWAKEMGMKRVFVLDDNEVYGRGLAKLFEDHCDEIGLEVVGHDSIDAKALEFRSLMTKIKSRDPDLVYFGGTTQTKGGQIAKDMLAVGLRAKLMAPDGCMETAFIEAAGPENVNDRCYITFGGIPAEAFQNATPEFIEKNKAAKEFVDAYQRRFGRMPEAYAIYGYEAGKVALEAIRRAGKKDRAAIVSACLGIKDFHGALGTWSFDANGDTTMKKLSGSTVHDGKFKFVKLLGE
jgi:branched-chain amino acid transport system substrate-binding protein